MEPTDTPTDSHIINVTDKSTFRDMSNSLNELVSYMRNTAEPYILFTNPSRCAEARDIMDLGIRLVHLGVQWGYPFRGCSPFISMGQSPEPITGDLFTVAITRTRSKDNA